MKLELASRPYRRGIATVRSASYNVYVKFAVERAVGAMGSASSGHRTLGAKKSRETAAAAGHEGLGLLPLKGDRKAHDDAGW